MSDTDEQNFLSESQQKEILKRDREYENGEIEVFTLQEVITHFKIRKKSGKDNQ